MRSFVLPLAILISLTTSLPLAAQSALQGVVTDNANVPLGGIEVSLYQQQNGQWVYKDYQNTPEDGSYAFTDLADGTYTLLARDWGQVWAFQYYGGAAFVADAIPIAVNGASVAIDFVLEPGGRITGRLTDPGGRGLDYPLVFVWDDSDPRQVLFVSTPEEFSGVYTFGGLPSGNFYVHFSGRQGLTSYVGYYDDAEALADATPVPVTVGQETAGIDGELGLPPGGVIRGEILDPYGRTFDFAAAEAYSWTGSGWELAGRAETAFYEGEYSLAVPPGTYRLRFEGGSFLQENLPTVEYFDDVLQVEDSIDVTVALDETLSGFDVNLGNLATASLSGTVTDSDTGVPLAGIEVYPADRKGRVLWDQVVTTNAAGEYTVEGLWPEGYHLEFYDPGFVYAGENVQEVLVGEDPVTGVDAALAVAAAPLAGSVSGTVTYTNGDPVFNARVSVYSQDEHSSASGFAATDSSGFFRVRNLPAGDYLVSFSTPFAVPEHYDNAASAEDASTVTVLDGVDTAGIDAALEPAGVITGRITNAFGNDFFIATATAFAFDGTDWQPVADTGIAFETDYRLESVPVGPVRVRFTGRSSTFGDTLIEFYDDAAMVETATDINVVFGTVIDGIDGALGELPPGTISGTVTDGSSTPLGGIVVRIYDDELFLEGELETGADGSYEVPGLRDGTYYVEFIDPSLTYPREAWNNVASLDLATPINVTGAAVAGIDAVLDGSGPGPGGGGMRGTVTDAQSGLPLEGVRVSCTPVGDHVSAAPCFAETAADGTYSLGGLLPAGDYLVRFASADGGYGAEWYDNAALREQATPVTTTLGAWTDGIAAALEPAGAISGTVTNEDGFPYGILVVTAYSWDGSVWQPFKSFVAATETEYRIDGLPAGTWRLRFRGSSFSGTSIDIEYFDDAATVDTAMDINVVAGQVVTGIDAALGNVEGDPHHVWSNGFESGSLSSWSSAFSSER